jgi:hypothetical protein
MMLIRFFNFKMLLAAGCLFLSCSKDENKPDPEPEPTPTVTYGRVDITFTNYAGSAPLVYDTAPYVNAAGDTFTVSKFNYYISNLVLIREDNSTYLVPESYTIIKHGPLEGRIINLNVPVGKYKALKFLLGVDSARNNSGAQTGGLDTQYASDMYWGWSSGYIFLKFEGTTAGSSLPKKGLQYHIGGYGGVNRTQRNFDLSFGTSRLDASQSANHTIQIKTDLLELFKSPVNISFANYSTVTSVGTSAKMVADNYADLFTFDKIQ